MHIEHKTVNIKDLSWVYCVLIFLCFKRFTFIKQFWFALMCVYKADR